MTEIRRDICPINEMPDWPNMILNSFWGAEVANYFFGSYSSIWPELPENIVKIVP
jgi:hypothetical protein